jgi:hypothetical protein
VSAVYDFHQDGVPDINALEDLSRYIPPKTAATVQPVDGSLPQLAFEQDILGRFRAEIRRRGVVGEESTAATVFLAVVSQHLDKPVSLAVKGHSASGKSYTVEQTVKFFPKSAVLTMTAMSERALVYSKEEYAHRTIVMYELTGMREGVEDDLTSYLVRSLLSEGRIEYQVTVRDKKEGFVTKTIVKEGPTNLIFTTTKTRVHAENETRILSLSTDDSRAQTTRVFMQLAIEDNHEPQYDDWHALHDWLKDAEHQVTIPYARRLAELIPPIAVRLRRDFSAVLSLIRAHAVLHQLSRDRDEDGRIVATFADYQIVRELVAPIVSQGVGATVPDTIRHTVEAVRASHVEGGTTAKAVAERLNVDKSTAGRRLRAAADDGYVVNLEERRGHPGRWIVGEPLPDNLTVLPHPNDLTDEITAPQPTGCAVAPESEGYVEWIGR